MFFSEITNGDVVIDHNKDLCFVDTIKWEDILEDPTTQRAEIRVSSTASCKKKFFALFALYSRMEYFSTSNLQLEETYAVYSGVGVWFQTSYWDSYQKFTVQANNFLIDSDPRCI